MVIISLSLNEKGSGVGDSRDIKSSFLPAMLFDSVTELREAGAVHITQLAVLQLCGSTFASQTGMKELDLLLEGNERRNRHFQ